MAIITQTDKRSGITYAYDTTYYWDKDKKQSRAKRTCVGKVDPVTGGIIPTRGRTKKAEQLAIAISSKTGSKPFIEAGTYITEPPICLKHFPKNSVLHRI